MWIAFNMDFGLRLSDCGRGLVSHVNCCLIEQRVLMWMWIGFLMWVCLLCGFIVRFEPLALKNSQNIF